MEEKKIFAVMMALLLLMVALVIALAAAIRSRNRLVRAAVERENSMTALLRAARNVGLVVAQVKPEIRITDFSAGAEQIFGYSRDDVLGQSVTMLYPAPGEDAFARAAGGGDWNREFSGEIEMVRKDGTVFYALASVMPIFHDDKKPVGALGVVIDITVRKRLEQEHRRLQERMQQLQKMESLSSLAGGVAHEFNNLLVGILGNAELGMSELTKISPVYGSIEEIKTAALRARELTSQMLAYSGKGRFVVEPLDVNEAIGKLNHLIEITCSKSIYVNYELGETLPPIDGDATQISQVIVNLVSNAAEAIDKDSGMITIATGLVYADRGLLTSMLLADDLLEGGYVYLEVTDNGCGMDRETQKRLFDPFFSTKFSGRGLGLAATLGIIRGHQGGVRVLSAPEKGTTLTVFLPVSETVDADTLEYPARSSVPEVLPEPQEPVEPEPEPSSKEPDPLPEREPTAPVPEDTFEDHPLAVTNPEFVLIVDDDEAIRSITAMMLESKGHKILLAESGQEALRVYKEQGTKIGVVLLDQSMPGMTGEETLAELRKLNPSVSVLLASAYSEEEASERFSLGAVAGYVRKPFGRDVLFAKVAPFFQEHANR